MGKREGPRGLRSSNRRGSQKNTPATYQPRPAADRVPAVCGHSHAWHRRGSAGLLIMVAIYRVKQPGCEAQGGPGLATTHRRGCVMTVTTPTKKLRGLPAWFGARRYQRDKESPGRAGAFKVSA